MIKIIAGKHKGRVIKSLSKADYRPSTARFREALFSILSSGSFAQENIITGASVLDLYCGTGSLSFEAISRGAKTATLVDINEEYLKSAKVFAEKIGESENCSFLKMSAPNLSPSGKQYNLIFMDPPYGKNLVYKSIKSLIRNNWLNNNAIIVAELSKRDSLEKIAEISISDERIYGNSKMLIMRFLSKE